MKTDRDYAQSEILVDGKQMEIKNKDDIPDIEEGRNLVIRGSLIC